MSQPGNYRYQSYDQTGNLKGGMPPMVNGQPNVMQHTQNGIPPPSFNSAGTPSSQSSRDPSRETSRDPSPTQYLHNQYRPQLSRPPMPPINGQQTIPHTPMQQQQQPPRTMQLSQSSPITSLQNPQNTNVPVSNATFNSYQTTNQQGSSSCSAQSLSADINEPTQKSVTTTRYDNPSSNVVPLASPLAQSQIRPPNQASQSGQSIVGQNQPSSSSIPSSSTTSTVNSQSIWNKDPSSVPKIASQSSTTMMSTAGQTWRNPSIDPNSNNSQSIGQSYTGTQSNTSGIWNKQTSVSAPNPTSQAATNPPPVNSNQMSRISDANSNNYHTMPPQPVGMSQQNVATPRSQGSSQPMNPGTAPPQLPLAPMTSQASTPYFSQSSINNSNTTNPNANVRGPPQPVGQLPTIPPSNSMQSVFAAQTNQQTMLGNQGTTLKSQPNPLNTHSTLSKPPQAHYPTLQQTPMGNPSNFSSPGATGAPPSNQTAHGSQQNLASQRKYPQPGYPAQSPMASAVGSPHHLGTSQIPGIPPSSQGQMPLRPPLASGVPPPLPGQQQHQLQHQQHQEGHYDYRAPYFGQMSNVPLDNMAKRYPAGNYQAPMNQLNTQMGNLNVTKTGFNEMWGQQSIDLLQCRNILPPDRVEPPKIKLHQEFMDSVNCSPDIFRCTVTKIPESNSLLQKCRLPLGVLIHPFKDLNNLPVIQCITIVRCRACRTYINPFVYFVDSKRWKCNLCYRVNELPEEFQFDPVTKSYGDPSRRPEVKTSTIEFIAPGEYMLRPPQPAVYLFVLDVSRLAVDSGYLTTVCETIAEELTNLPGDGRTQVGFIAVDSAVHFFSMPENVSQPHELIMLDVDDVFLPCPDNLIVNLKEREELVRDLLEQLPTKFNGTHDTNSALGAGLQAAFKLMSPTGGRVTVFQTCLPNVGPGCLQAREDPNTRASKDVPHLNPATDFYKRLALDCSAQQIAVDLFLLNSQYSDLATLSGMCKFSGGCIYNIPLYRSNKPQHNETLEKMLRRYLTRKIGFEAVMRIRCTRGLSIHTFHGNFFVRSTDLLSLPNVNPDAGFGMQVSIEENLADVQSVCFQAALLYTSSKGERRIRVHTMCLPVTSSLTDVLYSADQQAIVGLLSKMAVDRSQQSSLSDARDALINVAIDVLSSYKLAQSSSLGGLMAPANMKLLPLYIIAMMKSMAFRSGTSTRLDDRVYAMCQMKTLPLGLLMQMIYPDMYPVHQLDDQNSRDVAGKSCPQSIRLHLSAEKLDFRGVFLMDAGDRILIYVGKSVDPTFCSNVLGVPDYGSIPEELYDLPELDTVESDRLRNFVSSLQEEKPFYVPLQIIRDDSHFRSLFIDRLIEDRCENALSYYEFLQHLKTQVK